MNRREFIGAIGMSALAAGCRCPFCGKGSEFHLAMAGFTLNKMKIDEALAYCEKHGFGYLCVKDFHLPFKSTPAEIREFRTKCSDHGVVPYAVGPIYFSSDEDPRRYFDYAAALGVGTFVGVPARKAGPTWFDQVSDRPLCERCSALADEYKMNFAIHNHGRNPKTGVPKLYPAVPEIYELIKDLSPRMGFCVDWAYTIADGLDGAAVVRKYGKRIFDGHIRCLKSADNGSVSCAPADRCFDYAGIFAALREVGYSGCLALECADAFTSGHSEWIDESREYFSELI